MFWAVREESKLESLSRRRCGSQQSRWLIHSKIVRGTANFAVAPAMTREEAERCIATGIDLAQTAAADGITLLGIVRWE